MIHGIYVKSKPKSKWHLVSLATSAEAANHEVDSFREQALLEGNEEAKIGIQIFDSVFYIPEYMTEIKDRKPQYN